MAFNGSPDEQFSSRSLSFATHRVTVYWLKLISSRGLAWRVEAGKERGRIGGMGNFRNEVPGGGGGGTNDTRIKAKLRNEAELRSGGGEKKRMAHFLSEIQNRRGLSLYKLKRNRATIPFSLSLSITLFFLLLFFLSSFSLLLFFGNGSEQKGSRGKRRGKVVCV